MKAPISEKAAKLLESENITSREVAVAIRKIRAEKADSSGVEGTHVVVKSVPRKAD